MKPMKTLEDYYNLIDDRPAKFTADEVGFRKAATTAMCASCIHWYRSAGGEHDVCEIMRPENEQVPYDWVCRFWTSDGEKFPLLEGE